MHYFSRKINREVKEVYWHSFLSNLALSLVFIFEPIYLYSLGYSLQGIMWYYLMIYAWYCGLIFSGARFASRFGYKHAILVSNIFYVAYWITLFSVRAHPALFFVAPMLFALQKSWFWPAYDADVAMGQAKSQRGREVGVLLSIVQVAFVAGPVLGGFVSEQFGFLVLFVLASILMVASVYPLFRSREVYSRHDFHFRNFWQMFRKYPRDFFGYFGYAEDLMVMSLWPVYMFIVIPDFLGVGAVSTVAAVIGTVLMLYVGRLTDRMPKHALIEVSSIFYAATWILRFAARGLAPVLTFDALGKAGKDILFVPMNSLVYERAGSGKADHAIAYSVFFEFSLSVAKVLTALAAIVILAAGGSIFWVFAMTGALVLFYNFLR